MHEELKHTSILETLCIQQPQLRFVPKVLEERPLSSHRQTMISKTPEQTRKRPRIEQTANVSTYSDFGAVRNTEGGFLPATLVQRLKESDNWKEKVATIKQIEQTFRSQSQTQLKQHLKPFIDFLNETLPDLNLTVTLTILQMIEDLVTSPELSKASDLTILVPNCLEKFGDSRIAVRRMTFKVFKHLLDVVNPDVLLPKILQGLYSPNWHIREEVMRIFLAAVISKENCDTSSLVQPVAMMLDDCKAKVRQTAEETLAAIAQMSKSPSVMKEMKTLLDEGALYRVEDRIRSRSLPIVQETGITFSPKEAPKIMPPSRIYSRTPRPMPRILIDAAQLPQTPKTDNLTAIEQDRSEILKLKKRKMVRDLSVDLDASSISQSTHSTPIKRNLVRKLPKADVERDSDKVPVYLKEDEITRLERPQDALNNCMNSGGVTEWTDQFQMLNNLRSLIKNHPQELLAEGAIHKITLTVLKWADSLRSSLAKNALIVLGELFQGLGSNADSEVDTAVSCLMRKCVDTNIFLAEEAEKAMFSLCDNCSLPKVSVILTSIATGTKNPAVRAKTSMCFGRVFKKALSTNLKLKDLDRILKLLSGYVLDAAADVRANARDALLVLMGGYNSSEDFYKLLSRILTQHDFQQVKEALSRAEVAQTPIKAKPVLKTKGLSPSKTFDPAERDSIDEVLRTIEQKATSSDWKKKYEAFTDLETLVANKKDHLNPVSQVFKVTEILAQGMRDGNMKVSVHALSTSNRLVSILGQLLTPHLNLILGLVFQACVSTNTSVRNLAETAWNGLKGQIEGTALFIAACSCARVATPKVLQKIVSLILPILSEVHRKKPKLIEQYAVPLCSKLQEGEKTTALEDLQRALKSLT
mmetsp:Transcript_4986/g.9380  ORF Transcript_4986/g.9380 Transcript_4986/m.9380 type:complete len:869 (-) Transcript_4986:12-2618(-)